MGEAGEIEDEGERNGWYRMEGRTGERTGK